MSAPERIVIASRESALALWQARHIQSRLAALYRGTAVEILGMTTEGDRRLDASLAKIGGKGLFVKELEEALANGSADIAVHSVKDVPMLLPPGYVLAAICERADPRDAFVSNRYADLAALREIARAPRTHFSSQERGKSSRCAATCRRGSGSSTTATTTR